MLELKEISKNYNTKKPNRVEVLGHIDLKVSKGDFVAILGPNGCGKTTLLEIIGGLIKQTKGQVLINTKSHNQKHSIAYIFQDYRNALLPWLTAKDNIIFPLKLNKTSKFERLKRFSDICEVIKTDIDFNCYPYQLSGGQQQLISILRGLVVNPDLCLFDEPLSSLDYQTKIFLLKVLHDLWLKTQITTVYVSHDIDEALFLATKIVVLSKKPTRIVKVFDNPLPFPRNMTLIGESDFIKLKNNILESYLNQI
jgi:NitT/TauT family transport system ATP-binding protein